MFSFIQRLLHHWRAGHAKALTTEAIDRLAKQVGQCEQRHSGQIRICVESRLPVSYLARPHDIRRIVRQRAVSQFAKLRVWDTEHNNGVLIYLQMAERAIEIVADRAIERRVSPEEWKSIVIAMSTLLKAGRCEEALSLAVDKVSALLAAHCPVAQGEHNTNELPNRPMVR